jgi:hypothetical protein
MQNPTEKSMTDYIPDDQNRLSNRLTISQTRLTTRNDKIAERHSKFKRTSGS